MSKASKKKRAASKLKAFQDLQDVFEKVVAENPDASMVLNDREVDAAARALNKLGDKKAPVSGPDVGDQFLELEKPKVRERGGENASVRSLLESLNEAVLGKDYPRTLNVLRRLAENPHMPHKARANVTPMANALRSIATIRSEGRKTDIREYESRVNECLSNLNYYLTPATQREEDALDIDVDGAAIDLPEIVTKPVLVDDVPLLVSCDSPLPRSAGKMITSGTYIIRCAVIGVPPGKSAHDDFAKARRFTLRTMQCEPHDLPLRRPDSDATWFPVTQLAVRLNTAVFQDHVSFYGAGNESLERRAARTAAQRSARLAFEKENASLIDEIHMLTKKIEAGVAEAAKAREEHMSKFKISPRETFAKVLRQLMVKRTADLRHEENAVVRLKVHEQFKKDREQAEQIRALYAKALALVRNNKKLRAEKLAELQRRKLRQTQPEVAALRDGIERVEREAASKSL